MALEVKFNDGSGLMWHVGQPEPIAWRHIASIAHIQADGDELVKIQTEIGGIPIAMKARVVRWFGDDARFIVANLNY